MENAGYECSHPQDCVWLSALPGGYEFCREPFPLPCEETCPPQSPQHRERQPQNFFDPVIARSARQSPQVDIRHRTEFLDFEEHADGVRTTILDLASGRKSTIEASYLAGCDGGGSVVRQKLGVALPDSAVLTYTTNAIFRCADFWVLQDKKPGYRFIFIGPEGTWATIVAINGRDQYRFSFVGDGNKRALSEPELRVAIIRAVGREVDFEILSTMPWIRREYVADSYGTGRVFLVGDAAHLNSPTGAFGMNTGMQDAADIGWKLEAAVRGWGGPKLLRSYGAERRPVALRNVKEATANLKRMMSTREKKPPREIFESGPEGDRTRAIFGAEYTEMMKQEWFTLGIHLGYWYEDSPVIGPMSLTLHAAIDTEDTNWIVVLKDVGPDNSVRSARDGEMQLPKGLPEREITRGWLKASCRALDPERSRPGQPWHRLTREAWQPVIPGEINEYVIELMASANLFRQGHRICVEITSLDLGSGPAGLTGVEYIPYHLCSSRTVTHRVYRDSRYPPHLLLPIIPA